MSSSGHPRLAIGLATAAVLLLVLALELRSVRLRNAPFVDDGPSLVDSFVRELAGGDPARVASFLTPELLKKLEGGRLAKFVEKYAEYGGVESVNRFGSMQVAVVDSIPYPAVGYYRTIVNYERNSALVEVLLVRTPNEGLKVWSFSVDSGRRAGDDPSITDPQGSKAPASSPVDR